MRRLYFTILLSLLLANIHAQNVSFNHLTPEEGLSQITINNLYIDNDGMVWIATRNGLNSYNGNSIQTFRHKTNNRQSLFCNNIVRITGDKGRFLYLLCTEGVTRMDVQTFKFTTLRYGNHLGAICYDNGLFVGENNLVLSFLPKESRFKTYLRLPQKEIITSLTFDTRSQLWIGTQSGGLYLYAKGKLSNPIKSGNITTVYEDSKHRMWVGSWNNGFWTIDANGSIKNVKVGNLLISNFVRAFCEDDFGNMWIGTFHGLVRYDTKSDKSRFFTAGVMSGQLANSSIWSVVKDEQGTLWIGSYFGGVSYFNPEYEIYTHFSASDNEDAGLSSRIVGRMTEDDKGNLWICTEGGGLNVYNRQTNKFKWYKYPGNLVSQNNLKSIYFDKSRNTLWVGTHLGGLDRINLSTGRSTIYKNIKNDPHSLPSDIVRDIVPYKDLIIVATSQGVASLNPQTGAFTQLLKKEGQLVIPSLCIDRSERLWIATETTGVFCYNLKDNTYKHYVYSNTPGALSCNNINNIVMDRRGRIWFSTADDGIDLYQEKSKQFINYGQKNGLNGDCVYAATPSSLNNKDLLLITSHGFAVFDTQAKRFHNFDRTTGFPLTTINENALYVTKDGVVFLGGVDGMVFFKEGSLYRKKKPYKMYFCRLYVNGKEVLPEDETGILKSSMRYTDEITLSHNQSVFSIEYCTSNNIMANTVPVRYRLLGSSDKWIQLRPNQHTQEFIGLKPGKYTLELRADNQDVPICRLIIRLLPPWYLSWWAYLIYFLLAVGLAFWLIHEYMNRVRLRESLKFEKQHVKDIEELNQSKLRFFTNVSHEIRTPLTVIISLAQSLLHSKKCSPELGNRVLSIYRNSNQLHGLISELLDFRKQEQDHAQIAVQEQDFSGFVENVYMLFKDFALYKDITLIFDGTPNLQLWFDNKQMGKVVNNLIINALKHTHQGGNVKVTVDGDDKNAYLKVADTGSGIKPQDLDKVFNRFYQSMGAESLSELGTGIGLYLTKSIIEQHHGKIHVESEVNKGTTFSVTLPKGNDLYDASEIIDKENAPAVAPSLPETFSIQDIPHDDDAKVKSEEDSESARSSILIVEDNDDIRQLLSTLFTPYYNVLTAVDGQEGLEMVRDEMPDIVLSDIYMPNMSGIELCKTIKQDFSICHIPVVLLTARTTETQTIEGLKIGADAYIAKPFNNDILVSRCNNLVNNRRLLQRKFSEQPHSEADLLASNPLDKEMLDKAMKIIDRYYNDTEFNVDIFAREMGMSRTAFFKKWKTLTGQTPKSFLQTMRLQKAAEMLRARPDISIEDVSYMNGFASARYFCKCFKDVYRQQPSTYRHDKDKT
ncbi:MAG: two-component regulator propeller domain-containing protein [Prevotella sp.]|nr:two-component regulator propeller domain-containing protein [Prevotella sp.]MDD4533495.1 two-component regulator propeller domain-containing protein [Prevotella sp.]